jgi:hypothetical protein
MMDKPRSKAMLATDALEQPMIRKYTIELPLPGEKEHPNARSGTWHSKARAVKKSRGIAMFMTRLMMIRERITEPIRNPTYSVTFRLRRKRDEDGLTTWIKAQIDGMEDAGLIKNDLDLKQHSLERLSGAASGGRLGVTFTLWSRDDA